MKSPFLRPYDPIEVHKRKLPHRFQDGTWTFITWHLGDSIPQKQLDMWNEKLRAWLRHYPKPWSADVTFKFHREVTMNLERWLDKGEGECYFKEARNAKVVSDRLDYYNGEQYTLGAYVVMPNHVHVLVKPEKAKEMVVHLKNWKGITSRKVNQQIGKVGSIWFEEYWEPSLEM